MKLADHPRLGGLVLFLISGATSVWFYRDIVGKAESHSSDTIYIPHIFGGLVCIATLGIALMIYGQKVQAYSRGLAHRRKTAKDFLVIFLLLLPGLTAFLFLNWQLQKLGYQL